MLRDLSQRGERCEQSLAGGGTGAAGGWGCVVSTAAHLPTSTAVQGASPSPVALAHSPLCPLVSHQCQPEAPKTRRQAELMQSSNLIEISPQPQGRVFTRCFCLEEPLGSVRCWQPQCAATWIQPWKSPASLFPLPAELGGRERTGAGGTERWGGWEDGGAAGCRSCLVGRVQMWVRSQGCMGWRCPGVQLWGNPGGAWSSISPGYNFRVPQGCTQRHHPRMLCSLPRSQRERRAA